MYVVFVICKVDLKSSVELVFYVCCEREHIHIYQVIHHQSARDTLSRCLKE